MNYISVLAVDEERARERAADETGYAPEAIGWLALAAERGNNSRQNAFVFETLNDVTRHPLYIEGTLSEAFDLTGHTIEDGPVLRFGPEVTVGG